MNISTKVIVVTNQSEYSVFSTNILISNLNGVNSEKYLFICNNFDKNQDNALVSPNIKPQFIVSEYIEHIEHYDKVKIRELEKILGIQKTAFLII